MKLAELFDHLGLGGSDVELTNEDRELEVVIRREDGRTYQPIGVVEFSYQSNELIIWVEA